MSRSNLYVLNENFNPQKRKKKQCGLWLSLGLLGVKEETGEIIRKHNVQSIGCIGMLLSVFGLVLLMALKAAWHSRSRDSASPFAPDPNLQRIWYFINKWFQKSELGRWCQIWMHFPRMSDFLQMRIGY